jgi:hypothetical protein
VHSRRCAIWRLSDAQALLFVAAVVVMIAVMLLVLT